MIDYAVGQPPQVMERRWVDRWLLTSVSTFGVVWYSSGSASRAVLGGGPLAPRSSATCSLRAEDEDGNWTAWSRSEVNLDSVGAELV
jgi:hypothetical protein